MHSGNRTLERTFLDLFNIARDYASVADNLRLSNSSHQWVVEFVREADNLG